MKKLKLLLTVLIGLTIWSCSSDDSSDSVTPPSEKKLIKVIETNNYGVSESNFRYNSDNEVSEIEGSFTEFGEPTTDFHSIVFTYEDGLAVSAIGYENDIVYNSYEFNYLDGQLSERIIYNSDGIEDEKLEFNYNTNDEVERYNYYADGVLQQTQDFTYDTNGNITLMDDGLDRSEIQYDTNPTPSNNFSNANKIIYSAENLFKNLSNNNQIQRTVTYNYSNSNIGVFHLETSIIYDSDDYPTSKTVTQTDEDGVEISTRTTTFEYE